MERFPQDPLPRTHRETAAKGESCKQVMWQLNTSILEWIDITMFTKRQYMQQQTKLELRKFKRNLEYRLLQ